MVLNIYTDGGARGNPGPAGIGIVFFIGDKKIAELKKYIGESTNNFAEYTAVIDALDWLIENQPAAEKINFYLDSQLVVEQLNRRYKIKQKHLQELFAAVQERLAKISQPVAFHYIPRQQNKLADKLVNQALDEIKK